MAGTTVCPACAQQQAGSPFLQQLNAGDETPGSVSYTQVETRYDEVVKALGGAGEKVSDPKEIGPALDRAFDSGVPYLVNIITDVEAVYPRASFGV